MKTLLPFTRSGGTRAKAIIPALRDAVVAKATPMATAPQEPQVNALHRILRPQAMNRWMMASVAQMTPQYIESILRGAMAGDHVREWELFRMMLDNWPELGACCQELSYGVLRKKLIFEPWHEEDEQPSDSAEERMRLCSTALRTMRPEIGQDENDLKGTIKDIIDGWFRGVTTLEIGWHVTAAGKLGQIVAPRATFWVHPENFLWRDGSLHLKVDSQVQPFPENKFLVGIHKAKSGPTLGGALLRPLAWWWCAANFSADWLLNLAQIFGLPFRWANYDPNASEETVSEICSMLQNMGSAGWAAFPAGTTLEMKEAGARGGDHSPQGELLDRADRYARMVILGQTMSGSQDASKGGGKAFGSVEASVKDDWIDAAGEYVAGVLNLQLIPAILNLNYGESDEAPSARFLEEEEGDLTEAQRDLQLAQGGLRIGEDFLYKKYGIPKPGKDEECIGGAVEEETRNSKPEERKEESVKSRLAQIYEIEDDAIFARELAVFAEALVAEEAGHPFHGNQWTTVKIADEQWTGSAKEMDVRAQAIMKSFQPAEHPKLGKVLFPAKSRSKTFADKRTPHEFQAVVAIPELVEKGKWTESSPDRKGRTDIIAFHKVEGKLHIGDAQYHAELTLKEASNGVSTAHRFYLHRITPE